MGESEKKVKRCIGLILVILCLIFGIILEEQGRKRRCKDYNDDGNCDANLKDTSSIGIGIIFMAFGGAGMFYFLGKVIQKCTEEVEPEEELPTTNAAPQS